MNNERKELLQRMTRAAYAYATERQHATWEGKRRGLRYEPAQGVKVASCGAFRAWAILAHDGVVGWCVDGFRQRETGRETGAVCILVGDGQFVFPIDSSCSHHSLAFRSTEGSKLIGVTNAEDIPWDGRIEAMANELEAATDRLREAVKTFDIAEAEKRRRDRNADVAAASAALV